MKAFLTCSALMLAMLASGCEREPAGKPVARAQIGTVATPAPLAGASPTVQNSPNFASEMETACRSVIYQNTPLTQCLAIPANNRIITALADPDGKIYGSLAAYAKGRDATNIAFAMNGGGFNRSKEQPTGYFVENFKRLHSLDTSGAKNDSDTGEGGVFYGDDGKWHIRSTSDFLANVTKRPEFGVQAGPMLVRHGKINPKLAGDKGKQVTQNAVGIDAKGRAHFVISNAPVSLPKLAHFFRDELKVKDALSLDGGASQLWSPATERLDTGGIIGPIIVVEKRPDSDNPSE